MTGAETSVLPLNDDAPLRTEICLGLTREVRPEQEGSRPNTDLSQMTEAVGFEPTEVSLLAGFQDRCLKPLGHAS